jgi:hypothetical protein
MSDACTDAAGCIQVAAGPSTWRNRYYGTSTYVPQKIYFVDFGGDFSREMYRYRGTSIYPHKIKVSLDQCCGTGTGTGTVGTVTF